MSLQTKLYDKHVELTGGRNMADFAGYTMPLWYSSIKAEHEAVRSAAGIFDCTHMGVLEITGADAGEFLNLLTANNIGNLADGQAQYSFLPTDEGRVIDDLIVYRYSVDKYLMVVNAANDREVQIWLKNWVSAAVNGALTEAAQGGGYPITDAGLKASGDSAEPGRSANGDGQSTNGDGTGRKLDVELRDLRDDSVGTDGRLVMPVQGPQSKEIILSLIADQGQKEKFESLGSFEFCEVDVCGSKAFVCSTGYTGSKVGYEFLVSPQACGDLWDAVIAAGAVPCGLGARDSLRIEAGLPLYGHELEGEHKISPFQAGYGWAVALDKGWFVGCEEFRNRAENFEMRIYRLELDGSRGVRPVRENDGVLKEDGTCVGAILSSVKVDDKQVALVLAQVGSLKAGEKVGGYYVARNERHVKQGRVASCVVGDKYEADLTGEATKRFVKF